MSTPKRTTPRHSSEHSVASENSDPNLPIPKTPPSQKPAKTPSAKSSAKPKKPIAKNPLAPPLPRERKFIIVAKKASKKEDGEKMGALAVDPKKRQELAYEALRASQDGFFMKDPNGGGGGGGGDGDSDGSTPRKLLEEALSSVPEPGSGRVKHLVKAFESVLSISAESELEKSGQRKSRAAENWALPGMDHPTMKVATGGFPSFTFSAAEFFPTKDFERDSRLCSSLDGTGERLSWGSQASSGSRRSRRNSSDCLRQSWNKKLKVTSQQPFKLRTEQRGKLKEENFLQKVKEMIMEEEKKRIPIAQGLPWTTDEPECLVKPPVKESTEPIDVVLHSDVRAVERTEFDHHVAERLSFAEQMRLERERQQKLEEEEEVRRLRRELVPKAQPMPYFDRPFVPKRSTKSRTIPKEPKFHARPMKSSS